MPRPSSAWGETGVGDDAWCEEDFDGEDEEASAGEEDDEEDLDAEDESGEENDGEENTGDSLDENEGDDGDAEHSASRKAERQPRPVRVARATSRRHKVPKRSRTRCTDPYQDDDDDDPQDLARFLLEALHLPIGEPEKKPPMPETQEKSTVPEKGDFKKLSS